MEGNDDSCSPVICEVLVCGLLNNFLVVFYFAWTHENSEIKSTVKNLVVVLRVVMETSIN